MSGSFIILKENDDKNIYDLGQIKLTFINGGECGCEESCSFSFNSTSIYNFSIPTNFNRKNRIKVETQFDYDSLFVYQREVYVYAMVISETEGVIFYEFDSTSNVLDNFKYGSWRFLPLRNNEFTIKDGFESKNVPEMIPKINTYKAQMYLVRKLLGETGEKGDNKKLNEMIAEKTFGVFVRRIEVRLKYYIKGKIKRISLIFDYRHGEC